MALNLFAKKLSKKPIGTHVELIFDSGEALKTVTGVITDSDFTSSVEITTCEGKEQILNYELIKGFQETKSLVEVLQELTEGTAIYFSYGEKEKREPDTSGTVGENDGVESIEIITSVGKEMILNYSIIRSLLVQRKVISEPKQIFPELEVIEKPEPIQPVVVPIKVPLYQQEPEDILNANDNELKSIFDALPKDDRQKLSSVYERFKYGIKINDKNKMLEAANQARQILFHEDDNSYLWTCEAVLFCGYMLRRVSIYDPEVFLIGECFEEAAYAAWKAELHIQAGVYAITALLEKTKLTDDMTIILASSVVKGDDASGLKVLAEHLPKEQRASLECIVVAALEARGIRMTAEQVSESTLSLLTTLYLGKEMGKEAENWLPAAKEPEGPKSSAPSEPEERYGIITRLNWSDHTGIITDENGDAYTFRYKDIADAALAKTIGECLRADLDGKLYSVKFQVEKNAARNVLPDISLVDRARAVAADKNREDRFEEAFELCRKALETKDVRRALFDLIKHAITLYSSGQKTNYLKDAVALLNEQSFRGNIKVMVGGAPITQEFADSIGADAYSADAASAAKKAKELAA